MKHLPFYKKTTHIEIENLYRGLHLKPADFQMFVAMQESTHSVVEPFNRLMSTIKNVQHLLLNCVYKISAHVCCVCRASSLYGINMNASIHA